MNVPTWLIPLLHTHFKEFQLCPMAGGMSGAKLLEVATSKGHYVLKYQPASLAAAFQNYSWLHGKLPVPQVYFYEQLSSYEVLCTTKLKGHPLDYYVDKISGEELVIRYAKALGLLHNLPLEQGPVAQPLTHKLRLAKQNIEQQQVNTTNLQPEYAHLSLHELYEQLIRLTPTHEETVFTHGDFCLDNLFYDDALFTGYIDLDKGGLADRYQDIAIAVRTIKNELGEGMVDTFLQEYGLENLNLSKLEFYTLLDEFF